MIWSSQNQSWKYLFRQLVFESCLLVGSNAQLTSKKITKYLFGTRDTVEIFKLYELRYLLLKIYPLIHLLFQNPRANSNFKFQPVKTKFLPVQPVVTPGLNKFRLSKKKTAFSFAYKNSPPQILFATTTEAFAEIISEAAKICNMPHHKKRWVNGFITAAISDLYRNDAWDYTQTSVHQNTADFFAQNWSMNKEDREQTKEKNNYFRHSRWPSLVIIPDPVNNDMILSEVKKIGLPIMGLVNSHCSLEIDYPLFAQDQTYTSVYFFCHFLAILIAKEMAYTQHKHYILQKQPNSHKKKKYLFISKQKNFSDSFFFNIIPQQQKAPNLKKYFFFRSFLFATKKANKSYPAFKKVTSIKLKWYKMRFFQIAKWLFKWMFPKGKKKYFFNFKYVFWQVFYAVDELPNSAAKNINALFGPSLRLPNMIQFANQRDIEFNMGTPRIPMFENENKKQISFKTHKFFSWFGKKTANN